MVELHRPNGRRGWLIVEDESLVAMLIEDALTEANIPVFGLASRVSQAMELIRENSPDGALLDVNLGGEPVFPVARTLAAQGIPFLFLTGYSEAGLPAEFGTRLVLQKPLAVETILSAIAGLRAEQGSR